MASLEAKDGENIAYDVTTPSFGAEWRALAFYRDGQHARVLILRDGELIQEFDYPAYRIFNIAAHLSDIARKVTSRI